MAQSSAEPATMRIRASKNAVWKLIHDPSNWPRFLEGFEHVRQESPQMFTGSARILGETVQPRVRVSEDPEKSVTFEYLEGGFGRTELTLQDTADPNETEVVASGEYGKLPLNIVRNLNRKMLERIKKIAEPPTT